MALITIETFRSTSTDSEFIAADQKVQTGFFYQQRGLVRRTTARAADGEWLVDTMWASATDADAADAARATDDVAVAFDQLIDPSSRRTSRYETLE